MAEQEHHLGHKREGGLIGYKLHYFKREGGKHPRVNSPPKLHKKQRQLEQKKAEKDKIVN